jgi:hypothetical protein
MNMVMAAAGAATAGSPRDASTSGGTNVTQAELRVHVGLPSDPRCIQDIFAMKHSHYAWLAALLISTPALAHHPFSSEFDAQAPVTLSGTVTKVDWSDPHVSVMIDSNGPNNQTQAWNLELASPSTLMGKGWNQETLKQGQTITVKGYRAKSEPFHATARMIQLPGGKEMSSADDNDGGPKQ